MKRIYLIGCLMMFFAAGCASMNPYKVAEKNVSNAKQLRIGMTKAEVLAIMGEPEKNETFSKPDVWYYYYDCNWLDGLITEEECFPLVFSDGKLVGFGNSFYASWRLEQRNRTVDVELPPEAYAGENK